MAKCVPKRSRYYRTLSDEQIVQAYRVTKSVRATALRLGVMRKTIKRALELQSIGTPVCAVDRKKIVACGEAGMTPSQAAEACGVTAKTAGIWLRRAGFRYLAREKVVPDRPLTFYAYVAGLVDGEGCICITKPDRPSLRLSISMRPTPALSVIADWCGSYRAYDGKNGRYVYWEVYGAMAARVLERIRPFILVKAKEADLALTFSGADRKAVGLAGLIEYRNRLAMMHGGNRFKPWATASSQGIKTSVSRPRSKGAESGDRTCDIVGHDSRSSLFPG